jgi:hypothetical protein
MLNFIEIFSLIYFIICLYILYSKKNIIIELDNLDTYISFAECVLKDK